jgi:hypothetical protein
MRIFQDMSEVPMEEQSNDDLPECALNSTTYMDPLENPAKLSLITKPNTETSTQNAATSNLLCPISDAYMALQSPVPLLYSWSPEDLIEALNDDSKEDTQEHNDSTKTKKSNKSKCIRKVDVDKKKAIKKMRNRVSAQKSRDRKKKELDDLKGEADKLSEENNKLKSKLSLMHSDFELLQKVMQALPSESKAQLRKLNVDLSSSTEKSKNKSVEVKKTSKGCQLVLATLLMTCVYFSVCVNPMMNTFKDLTTDPLADKTQFETHSTVNSETTEKKTLSTQQYEVIRLNL